MCPGGQIVPTSTDPAELCVNGMSFSKRSSRWANSGLVSPVAEEDALPFLESPGREPLAGLDFQRHIERQAAIMGGGHLVAPVQTAPDFIAGRLTREEDLPPPSYRLGVKPARLDLLYPPRITEAVRESLLAFDAQIPGYAGPTALLHAPEARTSSPVRVTRSKTDGMSTTAAGLFPAGEGGGVRGRNRQRRGGRTRRGGRGGEVRRGEERTGVRRVGVKRRDENGAQEFPSNNRPGQTGLEMTLGL